ncbi:MAG: tRNA lysidine(34) synthetase TilS, partial [Gammaproteobacteria bacterium]
ADLWEQHCYETCKNLSIKLHVEKLKINDATVKQFGLEAALREHRLAIWPKLLCKEDILFLAHHLNDQIETVFLRLLRGTGVQGLSGIKMANVLNNVKCVRPLLHNTREEILNFANQNKLNYIEDDSNLDFKFSRNFLRHAILPKFYQYWPKFLYNINRAVDHLQQTDLYINNQVEQALLNCYAYNVYYNKNHINKYHNILSISKLLTQNKFLQPQILRKFIINQGLQPPAKAQIDRIYREIINARIDAQPKLKCGKYFILKYRDKLYIYLATDFLQQKNDIKNKIGNLMFVSGKYLNTISSDKAKKIFQQHAIPPWDRKAYSLVFLDNKLITIIGLWSKGL